MITKNNPKVSVILPVFNCEDTIYDCIASLLAQTFKDFELLVWNDGSNDGTFSILKGFNDTRIKIFTSKNNGLTETLNKLIKHTCGEYICRMDADDICVPQRLEKQVDFLNKNPNVVLLGTASFMFSCSTNHTITTNVYESHDKILEDVAFLGFPICHPTVMFRKSVKKADIKYRYSHGEENDFFVQCALLGELRNLNIPLLYYRLSSQSLSTGLSSILHEKFWFETSKQVYFNKCNRKSLLLEYYYKLNKNSTFLKVLLYLKAISRNIYRYGLRQEILGKISLHYKVLSVLICPILFVRIKKNNGL